MEENRLSPDAEIDISFSKQETIDFASAWVALSLAFTFFFEQSSLVETTSIITTFSWMVITVGAGFLLHELAHKIVAVRYNQEAEFKANYKMLLVAIAGGLIGFIFAAPGVVQHRGWLTDRQAGLIAAAGPVSNLVFALFFVPLFYFEPQMAVLGISINLLLAGFNMIPFGPLDGKQVFDWSPAAFFVLFAVCVTGAIGGLGMMIMY